MKLKTALLHFFKKNWAINILVIWEEPEKNNFYIAEACRYYEIFQEKNFKNCAIVSSYKPNRGELRTDFSSTTEDSENWKKQKAYLKMLGYGPDVSV